MIDPLYAIMVPEDELIRMRLRSDAAKAEAERLREGLRWIAAGLTGSYGTPQAFAAAILEDKDKKSG